MVGSVLAGGGLESIAAIAAGHARARVAVIVPGLGAAPEEWAPHVRYVASQLGEGGAPRPSEISCEVPIVSGDEQLGAVLMLGSGSTEASDYLHAAATAALTQVAIAAARDDAEQSLRGSLIEELRNRDDLDAADLVRRARRLGADLSQGAVAVCVDPRERSSGQVLALIASEVPESLAELVGERVYALLPITVEQARRLARRLERGAAVGVSSRYPAAELARALDEAELVLQVVAAGGGSTEHVRDGTFRLLFRILASHPEEVVSFYEDTLAPVVRYDEEYRTQLVDTLATYLDENCNMNATARRIYAHRHTVGYRLERVRELTGLDPTVWEHRERLGLGLKAHRILAPRLPR
jgi:sugar diacid utilization regulator